MSRNIYQVRELNGKPVFSGWAGSEMSRCIKDCILYCEAHSTNVFLEFNGHTKELSAYIDLDDTLLHWYEEHNPLAYARDLKIKKILDQ